MALILVLIGLWLLLRGYVRLPGFYMEGSRVRSAGAVLMIPFLVSLVMNLLVVAGSAGRDTSWIAAQYGLIGIVELVLMLIAVTTAYVLVTGVPLPAWLREFRLPAFPARETPSPATPFPAVLTLAEAARYLRISEHDVYQLIDEGSIPASRDAGGTFRIARSALDDFRSSERSA